MKSHVPPFALAAMGFCALVVCMPSPGFAQSSFLGTLLGETGAPPVIARTPMILQVLPETGACSVHPMAPPSPCPRVRLPDGAVRDVQIAGFHRGGPLSIEVDRLTYDWSQQTASHPYTPAFEYTGDVAYDVWPREEWGPCDDDACAILAPAPLHPAYAIPRPEVVARDFIEAELISDQGLCTSFSMPEGQVFPCHEVRLPRGEVIALDIGPHARFPVGSMLYFQRVIHAGPHPLFDHDRFDLHAHRRPGG